MKEYNPFIEWEIKNPYEIPQATEDTPKISTQFVPQDSKWKLVPFESCIYRQNKISKSSMAYFLNNYEEEVSINCE